VIPAHDPEPGAHEQAPHEARCLVPAAYGAAFMLMFARIGTMLMLLPGLGE
jgi:hypothetical protein